MERNENISVFPYFVILVIFLLGFWPVNHSSAQAASSVKLSVSSAFSINPGASTDLTINIDPGTFAPAALQWDFVYNTNDIAAITWKSDGVAILAAGKSGICTAVSASLFRCMILGFNTNTIGSGVLGTITVTLANSPASTVAVNFSNMSASDANGAPILIDGTGGTITLKQNSPIKNPFSITRQMP
jgi:hypothetical protein